MRSSLHGSLILLFFVSLAISPLLAVSQMNGNPPFDTIPSSHEVTGYQYQEQVTNGTPKGYTFQNRVQIQYYGNVSALLNMSCGSDVADMNLSLEFRAQEQVQLQMQLNASNAGLNLTNQHQIRVQNGSLYMFKHMLVMNLSRNTTDPMTCRLHLRIREQDRNCTWAWYDESSGEFVTLQSWYENGEIMADTTHFTTFVVLSGLPTEIVIDWWWYLVIAGGVIALVLIVWYIIKSKKTAPCPNGKERLSSGECPQ